MGKSVTPKKQNQPARLSSAAVEQGRKSLCAPLRPRRKLLIAMWVVMATWMAFLLVLYFKTIYPARHPHTGQTTRSVRPLE